MVERIREKMTVKILVLGIKNSLTVVSVVN